MRLNIVLNSSAGSLLGEPTERTVARIEDGFGRAGHETICSAVEGAGIPEAIERAGRSGADVVLVGGGDGTLLTAARILAGQEIALGILPLGTMNLLARDLGIPLDLDDAIAALAAGELGRIDMGEVNGLPFLNNSVIGFYARMVQEREVQRGAHNLHKWPAMTLAAWKTFLDTPRLRVGLDTGDGARLVTTPILAVANNAYDEGFGPILHRGTLTGGTLAVYVARHASRWHLLRLGVRFLVGGWQRDPDLEVVLVKEATVRTRRRHIKVANDGEVHHLTPSLVYRIRPGALRILRPRQAAPAESVGTGP